MNDTLNCGTPNHCDTTWMWEVGCTPDISSIDIDSKINISFFDQCDKIDPEIQSFCKSEADIPDKCSTDSFVTQPFCTEHDIHVESLQPIEMSRDNLDFNINDIVEVEERLWAGVNKPGGTARVSFIHPGNYSCLLWFI